MVDRCYALPADALPDLILSHAVWSQLLDQVYVYEKLRLWAREDTWERRHRTRRCDGARFVRWYSVEYYVISPRSRSQHYVTVHRGRASIKAVVFYMYRYLRSLRIIQGLRFSLLVGISCFGSRFRRVLFWNWYPSSCWCCMASPPAFLNRFRGLESVCSESSVSHFSSQKRVPWCCWLFSCHSSVLVLPWILHWPFQPTLGLVKWPETCLSTPAVVRILVREVRSSILDHEMPSKEESHHASVVED